MICSLFTTNTQTRNKLNHKLWYIFSVADVNTQIKEADVAKSCVSELTHFKDFYYSHSITRLRILDSIRRNSNTYIMITRVLIILFFGLSRHLGISLESILTKAILINTKPPFDQDKVFSFHTSTLIRCIIVCIQNEACIIAIYNQTESNCHGFGRNQTTDVSLNANVTAWKMINEGML